MQSKIANKYEACDNEKEFKLYSKGLIAIGEQNQELGSWFTASSLGGTVAAKRCLFHKEIKN